LFPSISERRVHWEDRPSVGDQSRMLQNRDKKKGDKTCSNNERRGKHRFSGVAGWIFPSSATINAQEWYN
jgi:hypothetical protein